MKIILCFIGLFFCTFLFGQQIDIIDFTSVNANLRFNVDSSAVKGDLSYKLNVLKSTDSLFLDAQSMVFKDVKLDGKQAKFYNDQKRIWVIGDFQKGTSHTVSFSYEAHPSKCMYFVGWNNGAPNQIWTQGQGKYTSNWFPSLDDTNDKIEFDLNINFDSNYEVIANGELSSKEKLDDSVTVWHYNMKKPMSSYLLALVVGKYQKKVENSDSGIPLEMYYYPLDSNRVEPTYRYSKQMFDFLESETGVAFPWQNYKQIPVHDFLYSGMENTSTTIFADTFVIDSISFVDRNYVNVNAHELAHQWFGDYVTAKSGEHHWLQEGFATYYALLAEKDVFGERYFYRRLYEYFQELMQQERVGEATSLLDAKSSSLTFYKRGAWVLHALREQVGDEVFRKSVAAYLKKHSYGLVETTNFISEVEKTGQVNLEDFQVKWIENVLFPQEAAYDLLLKLPYVQEYEMADCGVNSGKCEELLKSGISDWAKAKVIEQIPDRIDSETFKNSLKVRQSIAESVSKIPLHLKTEYEGLLDDESYTTKEAALYHLWMNFPEERESYFEKTKNIMGFNDKSFRLLWLTLALSTPEYKAESSQKFYEEMLQYTSAAYNYEVRINAFQYLMALKGCNEYCVRNLQEAVHHHNWRMSKLAKEQLELLKTPNTNN